MSDIGDIWSDDEFNDYERQMHPERYVRLPMSEEQKAPEMLPCRVCGSLAEDQMRTGRVVCLGCGMSVRNWRDWVVLAQPVAVEVKSLIERVARKLCARENEIWDEVTEDYRDRWRRDAEGRILLWSDTRPASEIAAEARRKALEEAAKAMNPMLRSMISRSEASRIITALADGGTHD